MPTSAPAIEPLLAALVASVRARLAEHNIVDPRLVGIHSGGVWLAQRLKVDLGLSTEPGIISSAMHRDDFARRGLAASVQTRLGFDVNGAHVLLLDDVLYTGRTIRAVINELFDHGRPALVSRRRVEAGPAPFPEIPVTIILRRTT